MTHTSTPWITSSYRDGSGRVAVFKKQNVSPLLTHICGDATKENGEFIVRACNAYNDLLEALEQIEGHWDQSHPDAWKDLALEMAEIAREALKKAKAVQS